MCVTSQTLLYNDGRRPRTNELRGNTATKQRYNGRGTKVYLIFKLRRAPACMAPDTGPQTHYLHHHDNWSTTPGFYSDSESCNGVPRY